MIVYFINPLSRSKRPCDLILPSTNISLQKGDICIREINNCLDIIYITSIDSSWSENVLLHKLPLSKATGLQNHVVFNFNGLNKRQGSIPSLIFLKELCGNNPVVCDFFNLALKILGDKEDRWNLSVIIPFLKGTKVSVEHQKIISTKQVDEIISSPAQQSPNLLDYMSQDLLNDFKNIYGETHDLSQTYRKLKKSRSKAFIAAIAKFTSDYPNGNIYSDINLSNL